MELFDIEEQVAIVNQFVRKKGRVGRLGES